jgi:O-antigen/teichoic acid export membrane protein
MPPVSDSGHVDARSLPGAFTTAENSFRNAKLRPIGLVAYKAFADFLSKGSVFAVTVLAARRLSAADFGVFALGSTVGWLLGVATDFGIQMHLARSVARTPSRSGHLLRRWLRVRIRTTTIGLVVVGAGAVALSPSVQFATAVVLFACVYATIGIVELLNYLYRGLSRTDVESSLTMWQRGGSLALAAIALALTTDVRVLALALLLPALASAAWSLWFARRLAGPAEIDRLGESAEPSIAVEFRRDVFPVGAGIVLSAIYFRVDVLLVEMWAGIEAVGRYNAVFRLIDALRLFPAAVLAVQLPMLCRAVDWRPVARVSASVTGFAMAATALVWASAGWLVPLAYGDRYAAAVPAFRILALSFPLMSLNFALTHQLIGWDRQRAYAAICGAALVANLALNAWLIPSLSIDGAAWATLGTEVFLTLACAAALVKPR